MTARLVGCAGRSRRPPGLTWGRGVSSVALGDPASARMTYGTLQHYLSEGWGLGDEVLQAVRERFIER